VKEGFVMSSKVFKLTKVQWKLFYKTNFGITNISFDVNGCCGSLGVITYNAWLNHNRIYVQMFVCNECSGSIWFNKDTFEYDSEYQEEWRYQIRQENYEEWKNNLV